MKTLSGNILGAIVAPTQKQIVDKHALHASLYEKSPQLFNSIPRKDLKTVHVREGATTVHKNGTRKISENLLQYMEIKETAGH